MNSEPLVSVCINVYNGAKTIGETLDSVCKQTYKSLQIIVVDDCSTDNTAEIVRSFNDARIELTVLKQNGKVSNANNKAFEQARGKYVAHIDSDDLMHERLISSAVEYLEANTECAACFFKPEMIDGNGNDASNEFRWILDIFNIKASTQAELMRCFFDSGNHLSYAGTVLRKSVIDEIGLHNTAYCKLHDFDYWTRLIIKHPIKIFDEPMTKYRMEISEEHSSFLDEQRKNVLFAENAQIVYKMINDCPDDLFLEAFADRLVLQGNHTHDEVELEKAFVLKNALPLISNNPILCILKLSRLFEDYKFVELARDKFNFGLGDFYKLEYEKLFFDKNEYNNLLFYKGESERLMRENEALRGEKAILENELYNLRVQNQPKQSKLRNTAARGIRVLKHIKHFLVLRDRLGKKYKRSVMVYGYFAMNLGDDLFFEALFTRYPNTLFVMYCPFDYYRFAERFPNVKYFSCNDGFAQKIIKIGKKLKINDLFEQLLLMKTSCAVHIGGSIYIQTEEYIHDYQIRKHRKKAFKPFYSVSCNFGPHFNEEFVSLWEKQFKKFEDICFRDSYSYKMFNKIASVRQAPDILFSYNMPENTEIKNSIAISVCNPYLEGRHISKENADFYTNAIIRTVEASINDELSVSILGFCSYETDDKYIADIVDKLSAEAKEKVKVINYSFETKGAILNELSSAEYIVGTRLHSIILGLNLHKKVLPIAYSKKINQILDDIGYDNPIVDLLDLHRYEQNGFLELLKTVKPFDLPFDKTEAQKQFEKLDKYLL